MINLTVKITPNPEQFMGSLISDWIAARRAGMVNLVFVAEAKSVKEAPVRKGNLARSRTTDVAPDGLKGSVRFTAPYAEPVYRGTGLFGPYKKRIVPTTKKALFWPGAKHPVRSIAGMKANPWIDRALAGLNVQKEFDLGIGNYLRLKGWSK